MRRKKRVSRVYVPAENWFVLRKDGVYWLLERVVCWAVVPETASCAERVRAVAVDGFTVDPSQRYLVHGADPAPCGRSWQEVFQQLAGTRMIAMQWVDVSAVIPRDFAPTAQGEEERRCTRKHL